MRRSTAYGLMLMLHVLLLAGCGGGAEEPLDDEPLPVDTGATLAPPAPAAPADTPQPVMDAIA